MFLLLLFFVFAWGLDEKKYYAYSFTLVNKMFSFVRSFSLSLSPFPIFSLSLLATVAGTENSCLAGGGGGGGEGGDYT